MRVLTLVLLFITAVAGADNNTFKNIDVFELEVATDTQISPDGSRIAYSRSSNDIMTDRSVSNIWIVDANGESPKYAASDDIK